MDRALDYESRGREFESSRAHHFPSAYCRQRRYTSPNDGPGQEI